MLGRAARDLQQIHDFLGREAPTRADRLIDALLDAIESLATMSDRGAVPRDPTIAGHGYRFLVCGRHLVFYKVLPRQVRVYRVLHGSRRYRGLL